MTYLSRNKSCRFSGDVDSKPFYDPRQIFIRIDQTNVWLPLLGVFSFQFETEKKRKTSPHREI